MKKNWSPKILNSFKKLSELDDDLKYIINKYNLPDSRKESNTFETLMRIIIGQQISRKAAESIYQNLKEKKITKYKNFLNTEDKYLKNLGLSFRKIIYIKDLAKNINEDKINLNKFKKAELNVLVTCTALDEGFDMPEADGALILSASSSKRQRVQRMGRVLRITENKPNALIVTVYSSKTEFDKLMEEAKRYHKEGVPVSWKRQDR